MKTPKVFSKNWKDYELIDTGDSERLERWGRFIVRRPFSLSTNKKKSNTEWDQYDIEFNEESSKWYSKGNTPDSWNISYSKLGLKFNVGPRTSKQLGLFPEQAANWEWINGRIISSGKDEIRVLNLFAYSGGASLAALATGKATVTHVDSSSSVNNLFRENLRLNNLEGDSVKVITEDAVKYVTREVKRGSKYDFIVFDPPTFGNGKGNKWKLEKDLIPLLSQIKQLISSDFIGMVMNIYSEYDMRELLDNLNSMKIGKVELSDLCLPETSSGSLVAINKVFRVA